MTQPYNLGIYESHESNIRSYCRSIAVEFQYAVNALLSDTSGKKYIDFLSGCGSLNYGHNDPDMKSALIDYISRNGIALSLDLHTESKHAFIERFVNLILLPRGYNYKLQFTGPTGANAVEAALKLARKVTGRSNIVAFTNGFHGVSLGALSATGNAYHRQAAGISLGHVTRLPFDGYARTQYDTLEWFEQAVGDPSGGIDPPAAFIVETVQGEGGLNVASHAWLQRIHGLAVRHGALLIVDDVQAGCGRTGSFFSFEGAGISPDIVVLAKSLSGFGLPFAALLLKPDHDIWRPAEHNGTFRGNNHAFVTAQVAISKFWASDTFPAEIAEKANVITSALNTLATETGWLPKGHGPMQGLRCPSSAAAASIRDDCLRRGLIIELCGPYDETLKLMPPLTIEDGTLKDGLEHLSQAVLSYAMGRRAAADTNGLALLGA